MAISLDPALAAAHSNLGDLMRRKGDHAGAERAYAKAVALHPGFAAAYANRADALVALGRLEEAAAACEIAIELEPALAQAYGVKGLILHRRAKLLKRSPPMNTRSPSTRRLRSSIRGWAT